MNSVWYCFSSNKWFFTFLISSPINDWRRGASQQLDRQTAYTKNSNRRGPNFPLMSLILLRGISQASSGLNKLLVCFCNRFFLYYSLLVLSPSLLGLHRMAIRGSFNTSHCDCSKSKCTWQIERNNKNKSCKQISNKLCFQQIQRCSKVLAHVLVFCQPLRWTVTVALCLFGRACLLKPMVFTWTLNLFGGSCFVYGFEENGISCFLIDTCESHPAGLLEARKALFNSS